MIREHDRVVLKVDVSSQGLEAGDVGTVIHVHGRGAAFEVEFVALNGETAAVVTVEAAKIRSVRRREIPHARSLAAA